MQGAAERLHRFFVVLRAYAANEEPPPMSVTKKIEECAYDRRIAAIHKLRVNLKSLTAEARIIRHETRRAGPAYRDELALHRRGRLREEARYTHLALALLRGRRYRQVEQEGSKDVSAARLVKKLGVTGLDIVTTIPVERWLKD
jgi:hypothetical protein